MPQRLKTDNVLFGVVIAMVFFGLIMVYSSSAVMAVNKDGNALHYFGLQCAWGAIAIPVMMWLKRTSYLKFQSPMLAFGSIGVVLMLLLLVYFVDAKTHRWLRFSAVGFQPSELAKPALTVFLAYFATWRARAINDARYTLFPAAFFTGLVIFGVVVADLGTAIVLAGAAAVVFFVAGLQWRYCLIAALVAAVGLPVFVWVESYRLKRVVQHLGPNYERIMALDPTQKLKALIDARIRTSKTTEDTKYQMNQSQIAIGSGGAFGLGLMNGRQKVTYLPEAHTDFIFAVVGEELGLFGTVGLLFGYLAICWRGIRTTLRMNDDFGRYLALGVTTVIVVQALINITVALGMVPTKGITLPLISYGGSSLFCTLAMMGILMNVAEHAGQE